METSSRQVLRLGLILNEGEVPSWVSHFIALINKSDFVELGLFLQLKTDHSDQVSKLYKFYCKIEKHRWKDFDEEFYTADLEDVIRYPLSLDELTASTVELEKKLSAQALDLLINLTDQPAATRLAECMKAGLWSLHYSDGESKSLKEPLGFWEVYDDVVTMECLLSATFPQQNEKKQLAHSRYATSDQSSAHVNRSKSYRTGINMMLRKIKLLAEQGVDNFIAAHDQVVEGDFLKARDFRATTPTNSKMMYFFTRKFLRSLKMRLVHKLFTEQWAMRYQLSDGLSKNFGDFKKLTPSLGGLWADPFITFDNGIYYLFFEDAIYDKENADISVITIDEAGNMGEPKPCLIRPYHLSYPFVFFWEGSYYMIPETKNSNAIEVYKAKRFPDQWEFHSNLMEGVQAVDTTLLFHNNKWWLFANFKSQKWVSINNELSIFYADSPLSNDWKPHAMNPVVSDVKRARPAGRIFEEDGKIIRPSQDSSVRYGYGLRLNEIVTLTEQTYEEREVDFIEPTWEFKLRGTHTLAYAKNLTVIDVLEWRSKFF